MMGSHTCPHFPCYQGWCIILARSSESAVKLTPFGQRFVQPLKNLYHLFCQEVCCISLQATFAKRSGALVCSLFGTPFVKRSCMKLLATLLARGLHQVS